MLGNGLETDTTVVHPSRLGRDGLVDRNRRHVAKREFNGELRKGANAIVSRHPHVGGAVSWRKSIARNWGLNAGYISTTSTDPYRHFDNVAWVGVERSFGPPDESVPYILLGSVGGIYHTVTRTSNRGLFALPGVGVGIRDWSPDRTWFVAPEVQFLMTSLLTLNVTFGFGL